MATKRRLEQGILASIVKYAEDTEVPTIFAVWSAISAVSACLKRDCFIDHGYFTVYPNLYIVLVAGSAMCKKSTAIMMAAELMKEVNPPIKMISQKVTCQALIGALCGAGPDGSVICIQPAVGIAVADELFTLINKDSFRDGMIPILNELYDCRDFSYETRLRGKEHVHNSCLSLLGGSTSEWLKEAVPLAAIGGGFTSRVVFVYRDRPERRVPWPTLSDENRERRRSIINDLCAVAEMRGPFAITESARAEYDRSYNDFHDHSPLLDEKNLAGYCGRRGDTILKVSMVLSASRSSDRIIELNDFTKAREILQLAEQDMPRVLKSITSKEVGDIFEQISAYIARHKIVERAELVNKFRHMMASNELDIMIRTLEEAKIVATTVENSKVRYRFIGEFRK